MYVLRPLVEHNTVDYVAVEMNDRVYNKPHCSEMFFILEGKGIFGIENKKYPVKSNDFVIINPNIMHTEIGQKDYPLKYIVLGIEGLEWSSETDDEFTNYSIVNLKNIRSQVLSFLQNMLAFRRYLKTKNCSPREYRKSCKKQIKD